jgi:glutaredoxin-like YruB-family protein
MKSFVSLIVVIGLAVAGWMNRDRLSGLWTQADTASEDAVPNPGLPNAKDPAPTPHPAREAQAQASARYPGLKLANSPLNLKFVALYKEAQSSNPALLSRPDWPLRLAEQAVASLGGAPVPAQNAPAAAPRRAAAPPVVIYTTSHCPYCAKAKQYLTQKGIRYQEVDIEQSQTGKDAYRKLGGNGVPLIMVGNTKVDGFDEAQLDRLLL